MMPKVLPSFLLILVGVIRLSASGGPEVIYQKPSFLIEDIVGREPLPLYNVDPTRRRLMRLDPVAMVPMERLAREEIHLAGLSMEKESRSRIRRLYAKALGVVDVATGKETIISGFPENPVIQYVLWSPDGEHIATLIERDTQVELWLVNVSSASAEKLSSLPIQSGLDEQISWASDSQSIWVKTVPDDLGPPPESLASPTGVVVRQTSGQPVPAQTHQGLLQTEYDVELFEYYFSSRLTRIMLDGSHRFVGDSGIYRYVRPSPDNRWLLVERLVKPWSYLVQADQFAYEIEVVDLVSGMLHAVSSAPLAESLPYSGGWVRTGARNFGWRSDAPATVFWVEAVDGGNSYRKSKYRDRIMSVEAPFDKRPKELAQWQFRIGDVLWHQDEQAVVIGWDWEGRELFISTFNPQPPGNDPRNLLSFPMGNRYRHPGIPLVCYNDRGFPVIQSDETGELMYLRGEGGSDSGDRPFLDSFHFATGQTKRIFRSKKPYYESPVAVVNGKTLELVIKREARNEPPNYYLWKPKDKWPKQLTFHRNPYPEFEQVERRLLQYKRRDGLKLRADLYLPTGYDAKKDGPLPTLVWAYPKAYISAANASQLNRSPYQFMEARWNRPLIWVTLGYAVVDNPAMPILAEAGGDPNNSFVNQLVDSGDALVRELIRLGVSEAGRIGLAGHSYGAFMTANMLAHSDAFCAGIARSGAYNRTLTPFGFQSEERNLWEAMGVYLTLSPFLSANKINEPLLLLHGMKDENSGTYLLQSERLFHAINGLGGRARLVLFPHESHTFRGDESILHMLWETEQWLELHLKKGSPALPPILIADETKVNSGNVSIGSGSEQEPE